MGTEKEDIDESSSDDGDEKTLKKRMHNLSGNKKIKTSLVNESMKSGGV